MGGTIHSIVHTKAYYRAVNKELAAAKSREEVIAALDRIRASLVKGSFA